jgi:hypothetical protein
VTAALMVRLADLIEVLNHPELVELASLAEALARRHQVGLAEKPAR